jgi:hypothetical protein
MPNVIPSEGTYLMLGDGATPTEVFAEVLRVNKIKPPGGIVAKVDTTHLRSARKESRPGLIPDTDDITFTYQHDPNNAQHIAIRAMAAAPALHNWRLIYRDGLTTPAKDTFTAYVTHWEGSDAEDEKNNEATVTMALTGGYVAVAGTP